MIPYRFPSLILFITTVVTATTCLAQNQTPIAYETPPVFRACDLVSADLLVGPQHRVREAVTTDGFTNTYIIDSDFGSFYAHGNDRLPERIREIYAIAGIRQTKESDAYKKALSGAAKDTVNGAVNLVKDPIGSVKGAGKGAARFFKGASERMRVNTDGSDAAADLKKYGSARRQIAGQYGVDPYTSNEVLRAEMDSLAQATGAGGLTFSLMKVAIPGGIGTLVSGVSTSSDLNDTLIEEGPYNLRAENRRRLEQMGIGEASIEAFLNHPALNPKHQTVITDSLMQLSNAQGKAEFLRLAMAARSEEDAHFFQRNAQLMATYNKNRSSIVNIVDFLGFPAAYTKDNKLVFPALLDYGSWTETGDRISQSFLAFSSSDLAISGHEWVFTGTVSATAKQALASRGIVVIEQAFQTLGR